MGRWMMGQLEERAIVAKENPRELEALLQESEGFLLRTAAHCCRRFVRKEDEVYAVALLALSQAVGAYTPGRGSFYDFARLLIERRLIDHLRSREKYWAEEPTDPALFESPVDEWGEALPLGLALAGEALAAEQRAREEGDLRLEIAALSGVLSRYGFSFFDLPECSPKAEKTRRDCRKAVAELVKNPALVEELRRTGMLPLKILEKEARVPRKILERHRRYIIAAVEILSGEYPHLADYMPITGEEPKR